MLSKQITEDHIISFETDSRGRLRGVSDNPHFTDELNSAGPGGWRVYHPDFLAREVSLNSRPDRPIRLQRPSPMPTWTVRFTNEGQPVPDVPVSIKWMAPDGSGLMMTAFHYGSFRADEEGEITIAKREGLTNEFVADISRSDFIFAGAKNDKLYVASRARLQKDVITLGLEERRSMRIRIVGAEEPCLTTLVPRYGSFPSEKQMLAAHFFCETARAKGLLSREGQSLFVRNMPGGTYRLAAYGSGGHAVHTDLEGRGERAPTLSFPGNPTGRLVQSPVAVSSDLQRLLHLGESSYIVIPGRTSMLELGQLFSNFSPLGFHALNMSTDEATARDDVLAVEARKTWDLLKKVFPARFRETEGKLFLSLPESTATSNHYTLVLAGSGYMILERPGTRLVPIRDQGLLRLSYAGGAHVSRVIVAEIPREFGKLFPAGSDVGFEVPLDARGQSEPIHLPYGRYAAVLIAKTAEGTSEDRIVREFNHTEGQNNIVLTR